MHLFKTMFFKRFLSALYEALFDFFLMALCYSRIGLDWACTVGDILHRLNSCPKWSNVITALTDHCIQQLPKSLKRTNLFTLLVLVGFPEVVKYVIHCWVLQAHQDPGLNMFFGVSITRCCVWVAKLCLSTMPTKNTT